MKYSSILKICTIWILFVGCGKGANTPEKTNAPEPEAPVAVSDKAPAEEKPVFEGPGEYLVKAVEDWRLSGNPRYFGPDNLYDLINGGAEVYTEYGLKKMVTADYKSAAHPSVTVTAEIYDMGSVIGAFGRFSKFLDGSEDPSKAGEGLSSKLAPVGRFGGASASFYKGAHLVNLTLLDESPSATMESIRKTGASVLPKFADSLFEKVPKAAPLPKVLEQFPKEDLVSRSEGYAPKAYANVNDICPCYTARYKKDKAEWTLLVTDKSDNEQVLDSRLKKIDDANAGFVAEKSKKRIVGYRSDSDASNSLAKASLTKLKNTLDSQ